MELVRDTRGGQKKTTIGVYNSAVKISLRYFKEVKFCNVKHEVNLIVFTS
jgi:hypothetical protein